MKTKKGVSGTIPKNRAKHDQDEIDLGRVSRSSRDAMKIIRLVNIGNSKGVILPKKIVDQMGDAEFAIDFRRGVIFIIPIGLSDSQLATRKKAMENIRKLQKKHKLVMHGEFEMRENYQNHIWHKYK